MSSFNYSRNHLGKSVCFGPSRPNSSAPTSLNPAALSYIPLNATAAPYIPAKINVPPPKKKQCPSFVYYEDLKSSTIYNATCIYQENNRFESCSDRSSTMSAPIPASISLCSQTECDSIDFDNIEPYVPMTIDIDQIKINQVNEEQKRIKSFISIISEDIDSSPHPAVAAFTQNQCRELLNAPVWSPESSESHKSINTHFAKIAIDEDDYQYIIHPNKKPIKYGVYTNTERNANTNTATDTTNTTKIGESYDECISSESSSNIASAAASIDSRYNDLYKTKESRIAVEGYQYSSESEIAKIALDDWSMNYRMTMSYIAAPLIQPISYIYCTIAT